MTDLHHIFSKLYDVPSQYHWVVANPELFRQVYILGKSPYYGKKGRIVRNICGLCNSKYWQLFTMRFIALLEVTRWWIKAGKPNTELSNNCRIFVGCNVGSEYEMWQAFQSESNQMNSIRLNQLDPRSFGLFYRPSLLNLWKSIYILSDEVITFLHGMEIEPIGKYRTDFIAFAVKRIPQYLFYRHWWQHVNQKKPTEVEFIVADTPAFACLDTGVASVKFNQHGLMRKSVLMPKFHQMKLLTKFEFKYYSELFPSCDISITNQFQKINKHEKTILIASIYDFEEHKKKNFLEILNHLLEWARQMKMHIVVRKHPCENDDFWDKHFPSIEVDSCNDSFSSAILRLKPLVMVSWFSTTLIDALNRNVLPVTISSEKGAEIADLVIDLQSVALPFEHIQEELSLLATDQLSIEDMTYKLAASL